jgi:PEP-CTERM motif
MNKKLLVLAAIAALALAPAIAGAVPIAIGGTGVLGTFSGTFDYTATNDTSGTVNIFLSNDSLTAGWITAFLFNIPTGADVSAAILTQPLTDPVFGLLGATTGDVPDASFNNGENGSPFGRFDIGAASGGGDFSGGGAPQLGIAQFGSASFSFALTGTGLGALTAQDFLSTLSDGSSGAGEGVQAFVVRFRGFPDNGSDKVPNQGGGETPLPEPGTLSLLGLGLASLAARWRARATKS